MKITLRSAILNLSMLVFIVSSGCAVPENQDPSENIVVTDMNTIQNSESQLARDYSAQSINPNENTELMEQFGISVTGSGSVSSKPDLSMINLGV